MRNEVLGGPVHLGIGLAVPFVRGEDGVPAETRGPTRRDDVALCSAFEEDWLVAGAGGIGEGAEGCGAGGGEAGEEGV
jgi:hypothetical protein